MMMNNRYLYYCKVIWWNDYADEKVTNKFYVFANGVSDVGRKIDKAFKDIIELKVKEINIFFNDEDDDTDFFYVDDLTAEERKKFEDANIF